MAQALKKPKIERDRFTEDGVRLFNASKEHGVIYCDGFMEAKYIQEYEGESVMYRGDGAPMGYRKGVPQPKKVAELLSENEQLQLKIRDLEDSQRRTNELLARLAAQMETRSAGTPPTAAPPAQDTSTVTPKPTPEEFKVELEENPPKSPPNPQPSARAAPRGR